MAISRRRGSIFESLRIYVAVLPEARAIAGLWKSSRDRLISRMNSRCSGATSSLSRYLNRAMWRPFRSVRRGGDQFDNALRRHRRIEEFYVERRQRVLDRADDRGGGRDRAAFARALD